MALLSIEHATKHYRRGRLERVGVRDVSLEIEPGELVSVWGARRSGRSTLLRIAAGVESPEEGRVLYRGVDLARSRNKVLGSEIGFCQTRLSRVSGLVVDRVAAGLHAQRVSQRQAMRSALEALSRVGAQECARFACRELDGGEEVRVALAASLVTGPSVLVIDEPTNGVDLLQRDPILALLRSIANEGVAVLTSTSEAHGLAGVDRALWLDAGELRGEAASPAGQVVPLRRTVPETDAAQSG